MSAVLRYTLGFVGAVLLAVSLASPSAAAPRGLTTGVGDPIFYNGDQAERERWLDETESAGAGFARINIRWLSVVATTRPDDPRDPADPAYNFAKIDRAVRDAHARGLRVVFTLFNAPAWAEAPFRPTEPVWGDYRIRPGTWQPDPRDFGDFAEAVARRYSGSFADLPRVAYFEAWNEPNLLTFLNPQLDGKTPVSPEIYRGLLNAMYAAVHRVHANNVVIAGATAPFGSPPGSPTGPLRVRPVAFLRELFCLKYKIVRVRITKREKVKRFQRVKRLVRNRAARARIRQRIKRKRFKRAKRLVRKNCPVKPRFDVLSHHPISIEKGPAYKALHPDDASTGGMSKIARVLRRAETLGTVLPRRKRKRPLWVSEFWWKSNPPDDLHGVPPRRQALWVQDSMFRFWQAGADTVIYYFIVDREITTPITENDARGTGLFFADGQPKPALRAFRFPFVARRASNRKVMLWSKPSVGGRIWFQRRKGKKWENLAVRKVKANSVVRIQVPLRKARRRHTLRARVGQDLSLGINLK